MHTKTEFEQKPWKSETVYVLFKVFRVLGTAVVLAAALFLGFTLMSAGIAALNILSQGI